MTNPSMSFIDILRIQKFRYLVAARFLALLGNGAAPVALAFGVLAAGGSGASIGIVVAARGFALLPGLLFGGVLADRFSRTTIMKLSDFIAGLSAALTAYLFMSDNAATWNLAAAQIVNGAASSFFIPASRGVMPMIVSPNKRQTANSLMSLSMQLGVVIGASGAGVIVASFGAGWVMLINALTFFFSAALISRMLLPPITTEKEPMIQSLRAGWREFYSRRWVFIVVLQFMVIMSAVYATLNVLGPLAADKYLDGSTSWGMILSVNSLGYILGGFLAVRIRTRRPLKLAVLTTLLFAGPSITLALGTSSVWIVAVGAAVNGISATVFNVLWDTTLQARVPTQYLSRVASYDALGSLAAVPIGTGIAGFFSEVVPLTTALWVCAGIILVAGLLTLCVREVRILSSDSNESDALHS